MTPHCLVYDGCGETSSIPLPASRSRRTPLPAATIAAQVPISEIMCRREIVCARADLPVDVLARLMMHHHIGCIPIVDSLGRPEGIVTKTDLVEQIDAALHPHRGERDLKVRTAADVMMPLALTVEEDATVAHAALMMVLEELHHVMVVSASKTLVGIVSTADIVHWLVDNDGLLAS